MPTLLKFYVFVYILEKKERETVIWELTWESLKLDYSLILFGYFQKWHVFVLKLPDKYGRM